MPDACAKRVTSFRDTGAYISSQDYGMLCLTAGDSGALKVAFSCAARRLCFGRQDQSGTYLKTFKLVIPATEKPGKGGTCDFIR